MSITREDIKDMGYEFSNQQMDEIVRFVNAQDLNIDSVSYLPNVKSIIEFIKSGDIELPSLNKYKTLPEIDEDKYLLDADFDEFEIDDLYDGFEDFDEGDE